MTIAHYSPPFSQFHKPACLQPDPQHAVRAVPSLAKRLAQPDSGASSRMVARLLHGILAIVAASLAAHATAQPVNEAHGANKAYSKNIDTSTDTKKICPPQPVIPTPDAVIAMAKSAPDRGFLWSLRKDNRTSYLYGTIHAGKAEWMVPGPQVSRALMASSAVAMELDVTDPQVLKKVAKDTQRRPNMALPAALQKRLAAAWAASCMDAAQLNAMAPEVAVLTLSLVPSAFEGLHATFGSEIVLAGLAPFLKKPVIGLETVEEQLAILLSKDKTQMARTVQTALNRLDGPNPPRQAKKIAAVWQDGDYEALANYTNWCDCNHTADDRKINKRLLDDRNGPMADKIDAIHTSGKTVFAAVGSLHMVGAKGLPLLLQQHGYQVERIVFAPVKPALIPASVPALSAMPVPAN